MRFKIVETKALIVANSETIGEICNAGIGDFGRMAAGHELIGDSLKHWGGRGKPRT